MSDEDTEVFKGYLPEDLDRVARLVRPDIQPDPNAYSDAFGVKIDPSYCPWLTAGAVEKALPFPRDAIGTEGIEYAALALALELAGDDRSTFTAVELGAGWGTWTALAAKCAERSGFQSINLVAFEADRARFEQMRQHLSLNEITNATLHRAAAWWRDQTLFWPVGATFDAGMAVAAGSKPSMDYRGVVGEFEEVPGRSIAKALSAFPRIDFLHIDIQGSEAEVISGSIRFLNARVRSLFVGTHSRRIEGDIIAMLRSNGWSLLREKPCRFNPMVPTPTLEGQTYCDGGQFWRNDRESIPRSRWTRAYRRLTRVMKDITAGRPR